MELYSINDILRMTSEDLRNYCNDVVRCREENTINVDHLYAGLANMVPFYTDIDAINDEGVVNIDLVAKTFSEENTIVKLMINDYYECRYAFLQFITIPTSDEMYNAVLFKRTTTSPYKCLLLSTTTYEYLEECISGINDFNESENVTTALNCHNDAHIKALFNEKWFSAYCQYLEIPIPEINQEDTSEVTLIPENSKSILVKDNTSRFSSAVWYSAIQEKVITLAGVGGIGSYVGFLLARLKPRAIHIYDDDRVEEANMSGQLYSKYDVGKYKVDAMGAMTGDYADYYSCFCHTQKFDPNTSATDIMICGFDNMSARSLFFQKWVDHIRTKAPEDRKKCLFIDGRLAAEELQVLAITGDNDWAINKYSTKYLFSDSEADATICSYKQTTYMANLIGSIIVNIFVNFVANEVEGWNNRDVPFFASYDGLTMYFKTVNYEE